MADTRTIRAWKDEDFRLTLDPAERDALPPSPAGAIELADTDLGDIAGGDIAIITQTTVCVTTWACVTVATIAISKNISCGACPQTLWSGSRAVSSIGCCPALP
jgi:mersacidin/lichenicidin family type 2 lantibiotic